MINDPFHGSGAISAAVVGGRKRPRGGRRAERGPVDLAAPRDAAAVLAEVYALILSWPTPEEGGQLEAADDSAGGAA